MTFTHYVPFFVGAIRATAVCGAEVPVLHSAEPSCPRCAAWIEADADEADALELIWKLERAERKGAHI